MCSTEEGEKYNYAFFWLKDICTFKVERGVNLLEIVWLEVQKGERQRLRESQSLKDRRNKPFGEPDLLKVGDHFHQILLLVYSYQKLDLIL